MTAEQREREELLTNASAYINERGLRELSLDALAQWLDRPVHELHQYFASDEDLILALVARNRVRLRQRFMQLQGGGALSERDFRTKMWQAYVDGADDSALFFEAYGLAIHDSYYGPFIHGINDWVDLIAESMIQRGVASGRANAFASLSLAVFRGAMLDYLVTRDRARLNAAMELWFDAADVIDERVRKA
jgi:AcrR family transcriptional regulator